MSRRSISLGARALLAAGAFTGAALVQAPSAGAAAGCPWWYINPSGLTCIDQDVHTSSTGSGRFEVTTDWFTHTESGRRGVAMDGTISINGFGAYRLTVELRNASGAVLGDRSWTLRRNSIWEAWWRDVSLPIHVDDEIASVRYTLRNLSTGAVAPARISRPTD